MTDIIVTFKSKKDPEFVTPPMQVPASFGATEMEAFLNTLLNQDKAYAFFYGGEQISQLPPAEGETTLSIEFIAVTKITSETARIELESTITAISIRRNQEVHTDSVVICTIAGETKEFSLASGLEALKEFCSFKPIRAVTSTETGVFVLTTTNKVVDVESSQIIFEEETTPIRTLSNCRDLLAVGLATNEIVVFKDKKEIKRIETADEIGKTFIRAHEDKTYLIVGIISGSIEIYDTDTWEKKSIALSRPITAMGYFEGKIYAGGLGGNITVCTLTQIEKECQSDETFISRIECGTVFFGYTNENRVLIRDKESFLGTHLLELESPVSDMKIAGKRLFVTEGCTLKIFNIFDE
ncbi:hypothetical protein NEDG_00923 [Nematocida displodere]|uniref:NLE domain-containing protein n=1 Tax=Nematocida displodere TaxID=1805483 RepID=A0A177EA08_9MICR|nr:hypothetical protein NEDG_00923 [Nematocida displodere]